MDICACPELAEGDAGMGLVNLPGYSPDCNADEAAWGWAKEEATGNRCLGTKALVQERAGKFLRRLSPWKDEVKCRSAPSCNQRRKHFLQNPSPITGQS